MNERMRWIKLIKSLREEHGVDIPGAEKLASAQPEGRRWVERQINSDPQCRKMALRHIAACGPNALIVQTGQTLRVRQA